MVNSGSGPAVGANSAVSVSGMVGLSEAGDGGEGAGSSATEGVTSAISGVGLVDVAEDIIPGNDAEGSSVGGRPVWSGSAQPVSINAAPMNTTTKIYMRIATFETGSGDYPCLARDLNYRTSVLF